MQDAGETGKCSQVLWICGKFLDGFNRTVTRSLYCEFSVEIITQLLSIALFMTLNHNDSLYLLQSWSRTYTVPTV